MIPFGPFHPDIAGINTKAVREARNVLPSANGFKPVRGPVLIGNALAGPCFGAVVLVKNDGTAVQFAGDETKLYTLDPGFAPNTADSTLYTADSTVLTADIV